MVYVRGPGKEMRYLLYENESIRPRMCVFYCSVCIYIYYIMHKNTRKCTSLYFRFHNVATRIRHLLFLTPLIFLFYRKPELFIFFLIYYTRIYNNIEKKTSALHPKLLIFTNLINSRALGIHTNVNFF